jgi:hypothetical protein
LRAARKKRDTCPQSLSQEMRKKKEEKKRKRRKKGRALISLEKF